MLGNTIDQSARTTQSSIAERLLKGKAVQALRLGALETSVLNELWAQRELDAKQVHELLSRDREIALSTVQTTIERLCKKGLVDRTKVSHAFRYRPIVEREAVLQRFVGALVDQLGQSWNRPALSNFLDMAEQMSDGALNELEELIRQRRALRGVSAATNKQA